MRCASALSAALLLAGAGCAPSRDAGPLAAGPPRGVSISPRSYSPEDFRLFLEKAAETGNVLSWAGRWEELAGPRSAARTALGIARERGLLPVLVVGLTDGAGKLQAPLTEEAARRYVETAESFAAAERPPYLGLGNEVDTFARAAPRDFDRYVALFGDAARAVKAASPDTKVFAVFQLERTRGLRGGLFGGKNDAADDDWALIDRFPDADFVAFTTYPGLIFKDPAEIPPDYYEAILEKTTKPVAFTEVGWSADASIAGWESSPEEQAAFAHAFKEMTARLAPAFSVWPFLYDQEVMRPFGRMGLIAADGAARPAWEEWRR